MMAIVVLSATRIYARNIPKHRAVGFHCRWEPALPEIDSQALTTSYYTGLLTRSVAGQGLSKKFWRGANHCKAKRLQNHSTFDFCASHRLPGNILIGDLGYKIYSTCHFMSLLLFRQKLVSWQHHPDISRPCHGFWSHSSHQDFNSTDFRCCSLGLDQDTPCFHRLLGELKYRFWVLYGSMMCHMDLGETGYTIDIYIYSKIFKDACGVMRSRVAGWFLLTACRGDVAGNILIIWRLTSSWSSKANQLSLLGNWKTCGASAPLTPNSTSPGRTSNSVCPWPSRPHVTIFKEAASEILLPTGPWKMINVPRKTGAP